MPSDRLAALRANRQQQEAAGPSLDGAQVPGRDVELSSLQQPASFFGEVTTIKDEIESYKNVISRIANERARSLAVASRTSGVDPTDGVQELVEDANARSNGLRARITGLKQRAKTHAKVQQVEVVRSLFVEALQDYQREEQEYRRRYEQRVERQYRIVYPDATPEEVRTATRQGVSDGVFAQALVNSTRYSEARSAQLEVQSRAADIQQIERTLSELAQLFHDMAALVEQQDETLTAVEANATQVEGDTEKALQHTDKAVESARRARKLRKWCFFLSLIIIIVALIAVLVPICIQPHACGKK